MYTHACEPQSSTWGVSPQVLSTLFLRQDFSLGLELAPFPRLAGQRVLGIFQFNSILLGLQECVSMCGSGFCLTWVLGNQTQVFMLVGELCYLSAMITHYLKRKRS